MRERERGLSRQPRESLLAINKINRRPTAWSAGPHLPEGAEGRRALPRPPWGIFFGTDLVKTRQDDENLRLSKYRKHIPPGEQSTAQPLIISKIDASVWQLDENTPSSPLFQLSHFHRPFSLDLLASLTVSVSPKSRLGISNQWQYCNPTTLVTGFFLGKINPSTLG